MKKLKKDVLNFGKTSVGFGISTAVGASATSLAPAAAPIMTGFSTAAGFMPIVSTAMMGKHVIRLTKKIK